MFADDYNEIHDDDDLSKVVGFEDENSHVENEPKDSGSNITNNTTEKNDEIEEKTKIKILTEENINSNTHSIFDVVLPLPGFNIEYPPNMKEYYKELLEKDNLTLELKQKNKYFIIVNKKIS